MSKKNNKNKKKNNKNNNKEIHAIIFFSAGLFLFFLAILKGSSIWNVFHNIYLGLLGVSSYILPFILMALGILLTINKLKSVNKKTAFSLLLFVLLMSGLIHVFTYKDTSAFSFLAISNIYIDGINRVGSGIFGAILGFTLSLLFGRSGAIIILIICSLVFILITTGTTLLDIILGIKKPVSKLEQINTNFVKEKKDKESLVDESNFEAENENISYPSRIDIPINEAENKARSIFNHSKSTHNFEVNPIETFVKKGKLEEISKGNFDIPLNGNNDIGKQDYNMENHDNLAEDMSELEMIIRKAIPVETLNLNDTYSDSTHIDRTFDFDAVKNIYPLEDSITEKPIFNIEKFLDTKQQTNSDSNAIPINNIEKNTPIPKKYLDNTPKNAENKTNPPILKSAPKKSGILDKIKNIQPEKKYIFPPIELLNDSEQLKDDGNVAAELRSNAKILVETLESFGVKTKVINVSRGPTVTRYELKPEAGVKISRITNLADDIALNLAAAGIRIEAPIPGKPAVGIEVPNKKNTMVTLKEIIKSNSFKSAKSKLSIAMGRDISGKEVIADMSKFPHILIAGATGAGKSVCINTIITSILYKASPDEVKLLMIDPKVVELGVYNGIPHLLVPVVTDPKKAAGALNWGVAEMTKRYNTFAQCQVRDITGYNKYIKEHPDLNLERIPHIVIIIDELADLMVVAANEVESAIFRLAQMARAAGMHLVIATQRPSVDVITGVIKANIPSRIAFAVSSQIDSRTIIDSSGAEKLLGRGDMLFSPTGSPKPFRVQGCFVDDAEVDRIVSFLVNQQQKETEYDEKIIDEIDSLSASTSSGYGDLSDETDDLLEAAIECIFENDQASTSFLQRRLRIGYARAARIMDIIESKGIIGPQEGSRPREILITKEEWLRMQ